MGLYVPSEGPGRGNEKVGGTTRWALSRGVYR